MKPIKHFTSSLQIPQLLHFSDYSSSRIATQRFYHKKMYINVNSKHKNNIHLHNKKEVELRMKGKWPYDNTFFFDLCTNSATWLKKGFKKNIIY